MQAFANLSVPAEMLSRMWDVQADLWQLQALRVHGLQPQQVLLDGSFARLRHRADAMLQAIEEAAPARRSGQRRRCSTAAPACKRRCWRGGPSAEQRGRGRCGLRVLRRRTSGRLPRLRRRCRCVAQARPSRCGRRQPLPSTAPGSCLPHAHPQHMRLRSRSLQRGRHCRWRPSIRARSCSSGAGMQLCRSSVAATAPCSGRTTWTRARARCRPDPGAGVGLVLRGRCRGGLWCVQQLLLRLVTLALRWPPARQQRRARRAAQQRRVQCNTTPAQERRPRASVAARSTRPQALALPARSPPPRHSRSMLLRSTAPGTMVPSCSAKTTLATTQLVATSRC
jgi:hypothetical protein